MSAMPPEADLKQERRDFRLWPKGDIGHPLTTPTIARFCPPQWVTPAGRLFDHLVGAQQDRAWDGNSERLGGLEVDRQVKFRRLLHR